ncbi:hypothetical protein RchiOBHm_Chr3g0473281 [Rosa chinensis]|uniref:Uncharacterized protein n=1 Tax=Rosa chinensis TaxID=74649 RepID=A0A2P6RBV4_ROSCH|nr:hypothetical protein RchiOBHm_Chr3g0473281 [Rosa chinensis]
MSHTTGTMTYAAKIYKWQLENKKDAPPNRKERFKITHLKKGDLKQSTLMKHQHKLCLSLNKKKQRKLTKT